MKFLKLRRIELEIMDEEAYQILKMPKSLFKDGEDIFITYSLDPTPTFNYYASLFMSGRGSDVLGSHGPLNDDQIMPATELLISFLKEKAIKKIKSQMEKEKEARLNSEAEDRLSRTLSILTS